LTKRNRKGFTLVEMMIVVLIIGVLVAIALPNFLRARENARTRACAANMKQIMGAIEIWAMEEKKPAETTVGSFPGIADLVASNYLKTYPTCPSGGTYEYTGTNLTDYDIKCSIHGNLKDLSGSIF
jgi:prepilin-type N-terminal cleavage/methylation domain-containing protein